LNIEQQITAALAGRAAQRDFVDNLTMSWEGLADSFTALVSSAADLTRAAAVARPPDDAHAGVFADLGRYLDGHADWRERASAVSTRLGESAGLVRVLRQRVQRETVNIGVIGMTGAGKSTLLRKLSGLGEEHIPSNRIKSSTATPSRIFHEWGSGPGRAVLNLHTWKSFREEFLVPLHRQAKLNEPVPSSLDDFRRTSYDATKVPAGQAGAGRYYDRLRRAHDSLRSYESLLRGGTEEIALDRLRPFVAYPADDNSRDCPYHAVRSVNIFCEFPQVGAVSLGLVDLPGTGEAGLDVHGRFLADLQNDTDLLFIVKRPSKSPATDQDWNAAQLADDAAAGVRRDDFAHQVVNRDADLLGEFFDHALAVAEKDGERLGIDVHVCDIQTSPPREVTQAILEPILGHLAKRLAYMDQDAIKFVLTDIGDLVMQVRSFTSELASRIDTWQTRLPDEEQRRRIRVRALKNQVSLELDRVRDAYDKMYEFGEQIAELHQEIERAGQEIRKWLADGLGAGSTDEWLEKFRAALSGRDKGHELDRQYNNARKQVVMVFDRIDGSLKLAVERLWGEVADALRRKLTEKIVPVGPGSHTVLTQFAATAREDEARTVAESTERLLALRADYGSIFLRVGRPVVRKIEWAEDEQDGRTAKVAAAVVGGVTTDAVGAAFGPGIGAAAGQVAGAAAGGAASAVARERQRQKEAGEGKWWQQAAAEAPPPARKPDQSAPQPSAPAPGRPRDGDPPAAGKHPEATKWHRRLTATVEEVSSELEREFHAEARRTLRVLAAAVDLFKDTATASPEIEVEYERLCSRAQREIWPAEFGEASTTVIADMVSLRQRAVETKAAASRVESLVTQARQL